MIKRNKTGGRQSGTPNKITANLRQKINDFLNSNWENLQNDFDKLEPKEKLMFYDKLLQYVVPRLQSTQLINHDETSYDYSSYTDEELRQKSIEFQKQNYAVKYYE